jgi:HIRAN domain
MFRRIIRLAGVTRGDEDRQRNIKMFGSRDIGSFALVREPDNSFDPNAIRVQVGEYLLGYVPRGHAAELAPLMDSGRRFIAIFVCRNEHPLHKTVGLTVRIEECPLQKAA